jgi:SAM-dependent MidA family methyltransferase
VSSEFLAVFRAHADAGGTMSFAKFMELALYHPGVGYYRRKRPRIGYARGTDFFTASTSGAIFGELVAAACAQLLRDAHREPAAHTFVEIGAESDGGVLREVAHGFGASRTIALGEPLELTGDCVVFSNELFDAQPCVRTRFRGGAWREVGVRLEPEGRLVEVELPSDFTEPTSVGEAYAFDRPVAAQTLAEKIAAQPWRGLFAAIDYGKTLRELTEATPGGTARAYFQHTQSNDLLARPGEQDLTCHVCWDWLADALRAHGFAEPALEFQEAFFIRHAGELIARTSAAEAARFSQRKLALMQLLHPTHLGQKFQVLHAVR